MALVNALGELNLEATQADIRDLVTQVRDALGPKATNETVASLVELFVEMQTPSGVLGVGNARTKFRDGFASTDTAQPDPAVWTLINDQPDTGDGQGHIVNQGGDASGASYLRISMSPFVDNSSVWVTSKEKFRFPTRIGWGISASQRVVGQEFLFGMAEASDTDSTGLKRIQPLTPTDVPITGTTGTVTSNSLVIGMPAGHPFRTGDRVILIGCADTRMNVGPVVLNGASNTDISVPVVIANGTYSIVGGAVRSADPLARAHNAFGLLLENNNTGNATMVGRRNGAKPRFRTQGISTTQAANSPNWADAFVAPSINEMFLNMDECIYRSWAADSNSSMSGADKMQQSIPDEEVDYRLVVRARNLDDFSKPIARIVSAVKTGGTTATFVTDRPHGLTTTSRVGIIGVRDQTTAAFPNAGDVAVGAIIDATTFQAVIGTAGTVTRTDGGVVFLNHGLVNSPGNTPFAIQSVARIQGALLQVTLNTTASGYVPGEYYNLWGLNGTGAAAYEGAYKLMRQVGATLEFASPGPDFAAINTGGAVIRRTDFRLHFARVLDSTRHFVEVIGGRGSQNDGNNAVPVSVSAATMLSAQVYMRTKVREGFPASTTNLTANSTYTLTGVDMGTDVSAHDPKLRVTVMHAAGIAHGHLRVDASTDNSTWRETHLVPVPSDGAYHTFDFDMAGMRYYRYRFTNGGTAQTAFYIGHSSFRGEPTASPDKNLAGFHVTPVAGQAIALSTTVYSPTIDLGTNHAWGFAKLFYRTDVAGMTFVVEQSLDNTNWFWVDGLATTQNGASGRITSDIVARYIRVRVTNGTTAASTLTFASLSLVSL